MNKLFLLLTVFLTIHVSVYSQLPSVGLRFNSEYVSEGYTLFSPQKNTTVYLINNCGETVNTWEFSERPALTCYILENGNLLRAGKDSLEIRDWDNNLIWSYDMTGNGFSQHHDIEPLPNGNILCIVHDIYTYAEMIDEGRNGTITDTEFKLDKIIEISPQGTNDANIVWEWKFMDRLIQDFDNTKLNFGVVEDHPELIDINFDNGEIKDWTHVNGIDYNAELDQILISTRHLNEIYIIDHSTTTFEAAGHMGGNSNKGGDLLWRWGNPDVYRQGDVTNQKLFLQHDAKWVPSGYLDQDKITVFNNGGDGNGTHSSIHLIEVSIENDTYSMENNKFLPASFDWSWTGDILNEPFFEGKKCGLHSLKNGNIIFCETSKGQFSEITKDGEVVWIYRNPSGTTIYSQNSTIVNADNGIFRGEKYHPSYAGFTGIDLTPQNIIEDLNPISDTCIQGLNIKEASLQMNHLTNTIIIDHINFNYLISEVVIYNLEGKVVYENLNLNSNILKINLTKGLYFIYSKSKFDKFSKEKFVIQ